jgi:hypothetical protein
MVICKHCLCYWHGQNEESNEENVNVAILMSQSQNWCLSTGKYFKCVPECRKM